MKTQANGVLPKSMRGGLFLWFQYLLHLTPFYLQSENINGLTTRLRDQPNTKSGTISTNAQTNHDVYTKEKIVLEAKRKMITVCVMSNHP